MPRKMRSHWDWSAGRLERLRKIPFEVPPRRKVAGRGLGVRLAFALKELYLCRREDTERNVK